MALYREVLYEGKKFDEKGTLRPRLQCDTMPYSALAYRKSFKRAQLKQKSTNVSISIGPSKQASKRTNLIGEPTPMIR